MYLTSMTVLIFRLRPSLKYRRHVKPKNTRTIQLYKILKIMLFAYFLIYFKQGILQAINLLCYFTTDVRMHVLLMFGI